MTTLLPESPLSEHVTSALGSGRPRVQSPATDRSRTRRRRPPVLTGLSPPFLDTSKTEWCLKWCYPAPTGKLTEPRVFSVMLLHTWRCGRERSLQPVLGKRCHKPSAGFQLRTETLSYTRMDPKRLARIWCRQNSRRVHVTAPQHPYKAVARLAVPTKHLYCEGCSSATLSAHQHPLQQIGRHVLICR